jgi:predicted DNA-binding transcriptional regulator YafY
VRPESFTVPDGFDAADHVARSIADAPWGTEIEVVLRTTLEEAQRRIPRTIGEPEQVEDGVLLRAHSDDLDAAAREIVRLGWPFTVRRPPELRDAVRRLGESLMQWVE